MTVVITGGSSGIGRALCTEFKKRGAKVFELSRSYERNSGVIHKPCDITYPAQIEKALEGIDKIDILINNAGFGISGACEYITEESAKALFNVDFFGTDNLCRAVIPKMQKCGGGKIINISSVAAVAPIPFQAHYSAAKAAINAYSQALNIEVKPFNIQVSAIMPGDIKTSFTESRQKNILGDEKYMGRIGRSVLKMEKDEKEGMLPEKAAKRIADIALKKKLKPLYSVGFVYSLLSVLASILPSSLRIWIIGLLYGGK